MKVFNFKLELFRFCFVDFLTPCFVYQRLLHLFSTFLQNFILVLATFQGNFQISACFIWLFVGFAFVYNSLLSQIFN